MHDLGYERAHHSHHRDALSLGDYLRVLRRRQWTVVLVTLVAVFATYAYTAHQTVLYSARAGVLLSRQNFVSQLTGLPDFTSNQQPDRLAQTQADVARSPEVSGFVLAQLRGKYPQLAHRSAVELLAVTTVAPESGADLLVFQATDHDPNLARDLANAYAQSYTRYRAQLDTDAVNAAIANIDETLAQTSDQTLVSKLEAKKQDLQTIASLQTGNTKLVTPAAGASQIQPKTLRTLLLGLGFGLILGGVLAFAREALDTRVRSDTEVAELLDLPVLARLSAPPRSARSRDRLVMQASATGPEAEAFRILRTNLDFANIRAHAQTIMVTSALEKEGKSTTIANLALALAQAGRRVCLLDLDLRRPYIERFFDAPREPGFTNVALGQADIDNVLTEVELKGLFRPSVQIGSRNRGRLGYGAGSLHIIPGGPVPPDPADILDSEVLGGFLADLKDRFDVILVDSPPLLPVSDGMIISRRVDAMLVVVRMVAAKRSTLAELRRVLTLCPAPKLGFIYTGASASQAYGYGGYAGYSGVTTENGWQESTDPVESPPTVEP